MFLSGNIPHEYFPAWMYHCQVPPPKFEFDPAVAGITWVDLVFPFFIFSMGAALPLAMAKKLKERKPLWRLSVDVAVRALLLAGFAMFVEHARPWAMSDSPTTGVWLLGLVSVVLCAGVYFRYPASWPAWIPWLVRALSIASIIAIWGSWAYPSGEAGFRLARNDIIILILANVWLMGGLAWLLTRGSRLTRIGVMFGIVGLLLSSQIEGSWAQSLWSFSLFGMFVPAWSVYLLCFLPGTIIGEILLEKTANSEGEAWSRAKWILIGWVCFAAVVVATGFLFAREGLPWACLPLPVLAVLLSRKPSSKQEQGTAKILAWSLGLLAVGLAFEPYQGGIKKDEVTLSYVLVAPGLAGFMLISWQALQKIRPANMLLKFTSGTGQNPLLAYIGTGNLVAPIWALIFAPWAGSWFNDPWLGLLLATFQTIMLGALINLANRWRIVLRA